MQKEFAKNSIQWRAADARAAGLHPLAALGINPSSATPVHVGSDPGQPMREMARNMYDAQLQEQVANTSLAKANANEANARAALYDVQRRDIQTGPKGSRTKPHRKWLYYYDEESKKA